MKKQPTVPSIAEFYHQLTKYSPENLSSNVLDPLKKPPLFKEYLSERTVDLKPYLKGVRGPGAGGGTPGKALRSISRLLYHTGGITDIQEAKGSTSYFRAAPSAGALYPVEMYLATREVSGLSDGVHAYSVREHGLVPVWEGDFTAELSEFCFRDPAASRARMFLILSGVFRRSAWRYGDRAYRRILLDAGHALGNAVAYAPAEGLAVLGIGGFYDAAVSDLLFLDPEEEGVLLISPVLPRAELEGLLSSPRFAHPSPRNSPPAAGGESGLMLLLHQRSGIVPGGSSRHHVPTGPMGPTAADGDRGLESSREAAAGREGGREAAVPLEGSPAGGLEALAASIGPVIRRRRSTRAFTRGGVSLNSLSGILRSAYAPARAFLSGGGTDEEQAMLDPGMISTHVVATRVEGLPPGAYRLDLSSQSLVPRRRGDFQTELWNLCLGQELGRDCAAAVIHVADLPACVERYGDRAYRYLHLDAGHLGQRINLAAVSRGVGVSGIGGFFDEEVNALLDLPEKVSTLYITLLGKGQVSSGKE